MLEDKEQEKHEYNSFFCINYPQSTKSNTKVNLIQQN